MKRKEDIVGNDIDPYKIDKLSKVPSWLIVIVLKYWAAAAAVYFGAIGGIDFGFDFGSLDTSDGTQNAALTVALVIFLGLILALFMNYLIRPFVRLMYNRRNNTFRYNMVNCKGAKSFFLNLPYMMLISIILYFVVSFLGYKGWVINLFGTSNLGLEPFTYGFCFLVVDTFFILIKQVILWIYQRLKYKRQIQEE